MLRIVKLVSSKRNRQFFIFFFFKSYGIGSSSILLRFPFLFLSFLFPPSLNLSYDSFSFLVVVLRVNDRFDNFQRNVLTTKRGREGLCTCEKRKKKNKGGFDFRSGKKMAAGDKNELRRRGRRSSQETKTLVRLPLSCLTSNAKLINHLKSHCLRRKSIKYNNPLTIKSIIIH